MKQEETRLKYLKALKELKLVIEYQPKISLSGFIKERSLGKTLQLVLIDEKLIKNVGNTGRGAEYVWNTIEPNLKMVDKILASIEKKKKRSVHKSNRYKKKELTPELIEQIKSLRDKGLTYQQIVDKTGVKTYQVNFALNYDAGDKTKYKTVTTKSYFWGLFSTKTVKYK